MKEGGARCKEKKVPTRYYREGPHRNREGRKKKRQKQHGGEYTEGDRQSENSILGRSSSRIGSRTITGNAEVKRNDSEKKEI